jgi:hypothetical protein
MEINDEILLRIEGVEKKNFSIDCAEDENIETFNSTITIFKFLKTKWSSTLQIETENRNGCHFIKQS